jgi:hypothetical protein
MYRAKRLLSLAVLAALLLAALAACGGDKTPAPAEPESPDAAEAEPAEIAESEPTEKPVEPEPTVAPTEPEPTVAPTEPEPTDTPEPEIEEEQDLDAGTLTTPADFSSFRSQVRMTIRGTRDGEEVEEIVEFSVAETKDPPAQHVVISGVGLGDDSGTMEMYQVEDTMYMLVEGQWMSFPAEAGESASEGLIEANTLLDETCGWKRQSDTEWDGVPVEHWTLTKEDLEACLPTDELEGLGEVDQVSGEVYIAKEGGYLAWMELSFEGENLDSGLTGSEESIQDGSFELHYEVTDVDAPFTIDVPPEALESSASPDDIPTPPDAEEVQNLFGMISLTSPSEASEVAGFYREQMPQNGWTEVSDDSYGDVYSLEYNKDGRTASLLITTDQDSGKTSVLITVSEPE